MAINRFHGTNRMTMKLSTWFQKQLQTTAECVIWGINQIPEERQYRNPPSPYFGTWPVTLHIFHLCYSEQTLVVPAMHQWLGASKHTFAHVNRVFQFAIFWDPK